ncbi:MAG: ABC transporter ATP-binding protein [Planctomycetes bacterium]|nr:ABC transporter ATP-binding protein [Planctomycetota bacterium]
MGKPVISIRDVFRVYKTGIIEFVALRGVSLEINEGEMVAIMGASGSGKSTLMNILGLLDRPTRGEYVLGGRSVSALSRENQTKLRSEFIGFIFQQFHLLPRTPAIDNIELPLLYRLDISGRERHKMSRIALDRVGLKGRERSHPTQLSGGQQQRVAIARALVTNPPLLLADEPTGNLDTRTGLEILALFQEIHREGRTVVMVTHEADVAACCERIIVLRDGKVLSDAPVGKRLNAAEELSKLPPLEVQMAEVAQ